MNRKPKFVPFDVVLLRERLVKAFMTGDLDEHARLTRELKVTLDAARLASKFFASLPVEAASVKFELGTLTPLPAE